VADVTVFVDNAVLGHLPPICVKEGVPTSDRLTFSQDVGGRTGLGVIWLLVLAGPLGWLGLFVLSAVRSGNERLTVTVPYSEVAYKRMTRARGARFQAALILAGASLAAFLSLLLGTTDSRLLALGLGVLACGALIRTMLVSITLHRMNVRLFLDASRRWVTMSGVHSNFARTLSHENDSQMSSPT
jgi:hypothetical protein